MSELLREIADTQNKNDSVEITAKEYFDRLKDMKHKFTEEDMATLYDLCMKLANKAAVTGQKKALKKLLFHLECVEREKELIRLGFDTFVYQDDIDYFIDEVRKRSVKIIELENYEREIPDEIVDIIEKTRDIVDVYYIVFTDYTGKVERQIAKEYRDKDPILFGCFSSDESYTIVDRFYYLGDWVDEYCDLTLEKMVSQMKEATGTDITHSTKIEKTLEELRETLNQMDENGLMKNRKV